jgi:hypothetical protein
LGNQEVENLALCIRVARFLIQTGEKTMFRNMSERMPTSTHLPEGFSCATKNSIADAERAADATVLKTSLGQTIEKHCFRVIPACGASLAAEVEE